MTPVSAELLPLVAVLDRIEQRLARLEDALGPVQALGRAAPPLVATIADTLDGLAARAQAAGLDLDERASAALHLFERLTAPEVAKPLQAILERTEALAAAVDLLAQAPAVAATVTDTLDGVAARLAEAGVDLDGRGRSLLSLLERVTRPDSIAALRGILDSGLLSPGAVSALGEVGAAVASGHGHTPAPVGAWGAFRALREPDVQRAVGLALEIARRLGASLSTRQLTAPR